MRTLSGGGGGVEDAESIDRWRKKVEGYFELKEES
jgi:hypothetical protein